MSLRAEVAKNNIIFTAGNIGSAFLSFVFSIVVARMLQPEQFGLFSFALVVVGFFAVFTDLGVSNIAVKFISSFIESGEKGRVGSVVRFFFKFRLATALVVGLFMLAFPEQISGAIFNKPGNGIFIMFAAGLVLVNAVFDFMNIVFIGLKNFRWYVALRVSERMLRIVFVVAFVMLGFGAGGAVLGVLLGVLAVMLIGLPVLRKYEFLFARGEGGVQRKILSFSVWAILGAVLSSIYLMVDALIVSMMLSTRDVGFYSIAVSWMTLITYVVPISSIVMYPYFSSFDKARGDKALQGSIKYSLILALPAAFLMSAFSKPIVGIFYGLQYAPAAGALELLSIVSITFVLSPLIMGYMYGAGKPKLHTAVLVLVLAADMMLSYALIGMMGIRGAATATLAVRIAEIMIFACIIHFAMKVRFAWKDFAKPLAASAVIYALAIGLAVRSLTELLAYGLALLAFYLVLMLALRGLEKSDIKVMLDWARTALRI